ncbi:MAG: sulfatase [Planctomycetota bacterium]
MSPAARAWRAGWGRLASVLALSAAVACSDPAPPAPPNVVLIIADTLRADRLSVQGGPPGLTPHLDALAAESARFAAANAHAPWTLPSIASLLTSLHPLEHGAGGRVPRFTGLDPAVTTLPDVLKKRGYASHAIVNVTFLDPKTFGVTRGFDDVDQVSFENNVEVRAATSTTDAALRWLDARDGSNGPKGSGGTGGTGGSGSTGGTGGTGGSGGSGAPFLLLVHYFDPHAVYAPPPHFREVWAAEQDRKSAWTFGTREEMVALRAGQLDLSRATIARAARLYDGEVAYLDAEVGRLLAGLTARGLDDDTVVVFTADHGEEFLEHGSFEHGHSLFEELLHVPLMIRAPGLAPTVVEDRVRLVDVAPTICELLDLPAPDAFVGESLLPLARGAEHGARPVFAHGNFWRAPLSSWTAGEWKLIVEASGAAHLYHLAADPREQTDLAAAEPARVAALRASLKAAQDAMSALARGGHAALTEAQQRALSGLGYGGGD